MNVALKRKIFSENAKCQILITSLCIYRLPSYIHLFLAASPLKYGRAPFCAERRAVCVCAIGSIRICLLTHMLRSTETSWRKGGMWQTGLERSRNTHPPHSPPSSPLFTFLISLKPGKKDLLSNQETEKEDLKNSGRQWQPTKYHSHWSEVHRTEVGILLTFLTLTMDWVQLWHRKYWIRMTTSACL